MMKKKLLIFLIFTLLISLYFYLKHPKLENHYHLEWENKYNKFQTWNIDEGRMTINGKVCSKKDMSCLTHKIYFSFGKIHFIAPSGDENSSDYSIDEKGIIYMTNQYQGHIDTILTLTPHKNCITSNTYFKDKLINVTSDFRLSKNYMMDYAVFPSEYKNELIIGLSDNKTFTLFNEKIISLTNDLENNNFIKKVTNEDLWVYVDNRITLKQLLPSLELFYNKGYKINFMSQEITENNEQVNILKKSITNITKLKNGSYKINSCEYCEKYPTKKIDSIFRFEILGSDSCIVKNKTTSFYQLRNEIVRSLIQNRTTRLNSEIQLKINDNLLFKDYLELSTEIDFVNTETSCLMYYHGKNDPDQEEILKQQNKQSTKLDIEFPIRISEIIISE